MQMNPTIDIRQKMLAKQCLWDQEAQVLWVDARKLYPHLGVQQLMCWDNLLFSKGEIPDYPKDWQIMQWANLTSIASWRKQIPMWVQESVGLFSSHQLKLLHYVSRYPQLLELLDHAPMLAWRLMDSGLSENEIVALLSQKRTEITERAGWPGKVETVQFLTNLRLRFVNPMIAEQVEICINDASRLQAMQSLPRINSMALSLAARFPEMIGCRLHQSLASMPCRPMQCQSMIALLEDIYRLAEYQGWCEKALQQVSDCRYLVEVEKIYFAALATLKKQNVHLILHDKPTLLEHESEWLGLSLLLKHYWLSDLGKGSELYSFKEDEITVGFLWHTQTKKIERIRCAKANNFNQLPDAKILSKIHLWEVSQTNRT